MQYMFALLFGIIGAVFTIGNAYGIIWAMITKKNFSMIPLLGGVMLSASLWMSGNFWARLFCWTPLFLDMGCVPLFASLAVFLIRMKRSGGRDKE